MPAVRACVPRAKMGGAQHLHDQAFTKRNEQTGCTTNNKARETTLLIEHRLHRFCAEFSHSHARTPSPALKSLTIFLRSMSAREEASFFMRPAPPMAPQRARGEGARRSSTRERGDPHFSTLEKTCPRKGMNARFGRRDCTLYLCTHITLHTHRSHEADTSP